MAYDDFDDAQEERLFPSTDFDNDFGDYDDDEDVDDEDEDDYDEDDYDEDEDF